LRRMRRIKMLIDLKDILIPPSRQRTKQTNVAELAISMNSKGQFHPLLVRKSDEPSKWVLVTGYRRLMAANQLKWSRVEAKDVEIADQLELEEIELDENLQREDLSWQEEVEAKRRILEIRKQKYGEGIREVAQHIGESRGSVWEDAQLAEAIKIIPELKDAKNKTAAQSKLRNIKRRSELEDLARQHRVEGTDFGDVADHVRLGDCLSIMKEWASGMAHLIVTDPPYGIDLGIPGVKKKSQFDVVYDDAHYDIMDLLRQVVKECYRILAPNAHMYIWFDIKNHNGILEMLTDVGFGVDPIPLVWVKNMAGQVNSPGIRWASSYETCFFCRKGDRSMLKQGQSNMLKHDVVPTNRKIHPTEKPVSLLRQLIETSSVAGELVVDPFGGSGSTGEAAIQTGRNYLLIEKDEAYYAGILQRLSKAQAGSGGGGNGMDEDEEDDWDRS